MSFQSWSRRYWSSFSFVGLILALSFFALSLSPSLLPRIYLVQGILSGLALAIGYGVGVLAMWLWRYLELPEAGGQFQRVSMWLLTAGVTIVCLIFLWRSTVWQNSIRELMEMEPVATAYPFRVTPIAILVGAILITAGRIFGSCWRFVNGKLSRLVPRRVSYVVSLLVVGSLLVMIVNGVLARGALRVADEAFLQTDKLIDEGTEQPTDTLASGSAESLIRWDSIGRRGKNFAAGGPTQEELSQFLGRQAHRPLRVYVGLRSADTPQDRAKLALRELKRVGGFERSVLVVATPTGTGWLDPGAVDPVEYLHAGDTAMVSMQYSFLPSFLTILVDPDRSRNAARILFDEVYGHWKTLPKNRRPKLYLHGLSLGALGSEACADLLSLFEEPIHGAVWSGPPFASTTWSIVTKHRNQGSPSWLPKFRDGTMVRFTARKNFIDEAGDRWGPMRFIYLQHSSDPITFFSPDLLYRRPDWLVGERGPDVSPHLQWFPIVTFLQVGCDMPMAGTVPHGYGHNISPASYIDAWIAVTSPPDWSPADTTRLKQFFAK